MVAIDDISVRYEVWVISVEKKYTAIADARLDVDDENQSCIASAVLKLRNAPATAAQATMTMAEIADRSGVRAASIVTIRSHWDRKIVASLDSTRDYRAANAIFRTDTKHSKAQVMCVCAVVLDSAYRAIFYI
jgi:hypothetical protein